MASAGSSGPVLSMRFEVAAGHVLHRYVVAPVLGVPLVVDLHHVGVVEGGGAYGLPLETRDESRVFGVVFP